MLARSGEAVGFQPDSLAADKSYGVATFHAWLLERDVTPCITALVDIYLSLGAEGPGLARAAR